MKKLIEDNELGMPTTTPIEQTVVRTAKWILGIEKLNHFYSQITPATGVDFAAQALKQLDTKSNITDSDVQKIPTQGGVVIVANHPHGALDGLLLIDTIVRHHPDTKFMGNFLLTRIEPLADLFISVDPFESHSALNITGIRRALDHLRNGGALIIFPAGEVATYQRGLTHFGDKQWPNSIIRFIRSTALPVVPIHISGRNSLIFHLSGKLHPRLRTLRLVRELLNKHGKIIDINIGHPLSTRLLHSIENDNQAAQVMRANITIINAARGDENRPIELKHSNLVDAVDNSLIKTEIDALPADALISSIGTLKLYFCTPIQIKYTLHNICELREQATRNANKTTINAIDTDAYDTYYHHLFIWDSENMRIVGAYRVGFGEELFRQMGIDAFYTHTLFDFSHKFFPILRSTIELGRSFIVDDYQRKAQPMLLLWRGLLMILMRSEGYRYLIGAVSISSEYSATARRLMISYIKTHHQSSKYSKFVVARHGIRSLSRPLFDTSTIETLNSTELIDKFIRDVDPNHTTMPSLLKRYLQLGGEVLSLNIDSKSNDSLDALMMLDIRNISAAQLETLTHEFNSADNTNK